MRREDTSVSWHARRAVPALLIRARLGKIDRLLLWEVSHVVHRLDLSLALSWTQNDGFAQHNVTVVGVQLAAYGTIMEAELESTMVIQTYSTLT